MSPSGVALGTKDLTIDDQQSSKLSKSHGSLWLQIAQKKVIANSCNLIVKSAADENLLLLLQDSIDNQQTSVIGVDSIQIKGTYYNDQSKDTNGLFVVCCKQAQQACC